MNRIVREHYPVENLPEDLRAELGSVTSVRVTVEPTPSQDICKDSSSTREALKRMRELVRSGKVKSVTSQEAVDRIRTLRDEWPT